MPLMAGDSWVPSNNQNPTYVNCLSSLGNGGVAQCSTTANFNAGTNGCKGCMDSYKVLFTYHGTIGNRYTDPSCTTFNTELGNVWTNFYAVKYAMIGYDPTTTPTHQVVYFRALTAQTSINIFIADLTTNVPALFTTVQNALATISAIIDPQYGLVAGLNCRVFGEDIVRLSNTMCGPVYTTFYLSRLIVGIASYGILFALCCIVCAGVRHYKHGERKDKVQQDQQDLAKDADKFQYGTKMEFK